jgi:hypothetical protein
MNTAILSKTNHSAIISIMFNFRRTGMFGKILSAVAPLALTIATGGAAAPMLLNMAIKMAAQVAIQKLGQELGLPPAITQMASSFLTGGMQGPSGAQGFQQMLNQTGFSAFQQGDLGRQFSQISNQIADLGRMMEQSGVFNSESSAQNFMERLGKELGKEDGGFNPAEMMLKNNLDQSNGEAKRKIADIKAMKGKVSPIMYLAMLLGAMADNKADQLAAKAEKIGNFGKIDPKDGSQGKFQQLNTELQGLTQELNTLTQAASNVIKTMGESASTMARKG